MAATSSAALLFTVLASLTVSALSRPCKTLLISYTFPADSTDPSSELEISNFYLLDRPAFRYEPPLTLTSLRDRTRDILVVTAALVFGVGCGALTSATVYLAWYLVYNRDEVCGLQDYDSDEDFDLESPKKLGYADLTAAPATPVSPLKE